MPLVWYPDCCQRASAQQSRLLKGDSLRQIAMPPEVVRLRLLSPHHSCRDLPPDKNAAPLSSIAYGAGSRVRAFGTFRDPLWPHEQSRGCRGQVVGGIRRCGSPGGRVAPGRPAAALAHRALDLREEAHGFPRLPFMMTKSVLMGSSPPSPAKRLSTRSAVRGAMAGSLFLIRSLCFAIVGRHVPVRFSRPRTTARPQHSDGSCRPGRPLGPSGSGGCPFAPDFCAPLRRAAAPASG